MARKPKIPFVSTGSNPNDAARRPLAIVSTGDSPPQNAQQPTYLERHHPDYTMQEDTWRRMEDLWVGEDRVKERGAVYLPPTEIEQQEAGVNIAADNTRYMARLRNAVFFNGIDRLTKYTMGHLYRVAPKWNITLPDSLKPIINNADLNGTQLEMFCKNLSAMSYVKGHYFVLVDMPDTRNIVNMAQQRTLSPYPYFVLVDPSELIDWSLTKSPNGKIKFNWIVRRETVFESDGPNLLHKRVTYFRVWYPDRWELYKYHVETVQEPGDRKTTGKINQKPTSNRVTAIRVDAGLNPLGVVPLVAVYSGQIRPMVSKPPLDESAHLNIHHYRMYSAFMNGLYYHLSPVLHLSGVTNVDQVRLGAKSAIITPRSGDAKYIETQGNGLNIAKASCAELAQEMWEAGMRTTGFMGANASGDAKRVSRSDFISWMNFIANSHEIAFQEMFELAALWMKTTLPDSPKGDDGQPMRPLTLNRDFDLNTLDANTAEFLLNARKAGEISKELFLTECKRGEVFSSDLDVTAEISAAKKDLEHDVGVLAKLQGTTGGGAPAKNPAEGGGPQPPKDAPPPQNS